MTSPTLPASALARPLDLSLSSNRYVVAGTVASTLAARLSGHPWPSALGVGAAGFLGWAAARELDPDYPDTAGAALPLAALAALVGGPPNPLAGLSVLSGLRVLAATVGQAPVPLDVAALAGQAGLSALTGERVAALVPGAALALSSTRPDAFQGSGRDAGLVALAALLPGVRRGQGRGAPADALTLAALGLSGVLTRAETVETECDRASTPVPAERVRLTRLLALGALGAGLLARETRSLAPLASAVLAVGLRRVLPGAK
ncbi:hypothetical protein DAETH_19900 [Deinococcus aetherius]|uniref:Uncharacterized protein n=1 Tax=Deinococcus aetherius TaxID=200252 RepID=A0ABN6RIE6_9DEIO|nr:hypothetical protein [Deinococcus aetherius]BDP42021.1 hypothetical protein DAETH_19900 [Deinococcus aetherius]